MTTPLHESDMNESELLEALEAIAISMAAAVAEHLPEVSAAGYLRFLDMMFHYTKDSGPRLVEAATIASDPALAGFFAALAHDERSHYRLAAADLASFGRLPSPEPPAEVGEFRAFWARPTPAREVVLLGALFVLERVASHLGERVKPALQRLELGPSNARFVLVHLQADEEHGASCLAAARRLASVAPDSLLAGARAAAPLWIAMHRCLADH